MENKLSYKGLFDLLVENAVLNNTVVGSGYGDRKLENGTDYNEEDDCWVDVYQYFIIGAGDAGSLKRLTNEIIYRNDDLKMYLLGVTHFCMLWDSVVTEYEIKEISRC